MQIFWHKIGHVYVRDFVSVSPTEIIAQSESAQHRYHKMRTSFIILYYGNFILM